MSCLFEANKRSYPFFITGIPPEHPPHPSVHLNSQAQPEDRQRKGSHPLAIPVNTDLQVFTAMLLVSKELSLAVAGFFYSENEFVLQPEHLETWLHRIGLDNSRCIQSIVLSTSDPEQEFPMYMDVNGRQDSPYSKSIAQRRLEKATRWQRAQETLGAGRLPSLRKITFDIVLRCCESGQADHRQLITALTRRISVRLGALGPAGAEPFSRSFCM
ncbi:hypothetical protein QBC43DRAFT_330977 [Cladorrhinum sp. PSN259]|nr:hypothetical protein QBC43DRAFT_330977 [Cladorrhinum sp. PSN259]